METPRCQEQSLSENKEKKRKLDELTADQRVALVAAVAKQVSILESTFTWNEADRAAAKCAAHALTYLATRRNVTDEVKNVIVEGGAIPALVKHLQAPPLSDCVQKPLPFEHQVETRSALALTVLAVKPEHKQIIVDNGALTHLVDLLKRHKNGLTSPAINSLASSAAFTIANLARANHSFKTHVRMEGGIPPLVYLLESSDTMVQIAAAGALRTLTFYHDENKNQIVECNALPTLILMLRSEDAAIQYKAAAVIGNLVRASPNIKKEVLLAGALQPVIRLLSSCCSKSQIAAAFLLQQFADTDPDCKVRIVQRGAVGPLIEMLQSPDERLRKNSFLVLRTLAQDTHNQAGIAHHGGLVPLLKLLDSENVYLQHNVVVALYALTVNEVMFQTKDRHSFIPRECPPLDTWEQTLPHFKKKAHNLDVGDPSAGTRPSHFLGKLPFLGAKNEVRHR